MKKRRNTIMKVLGIIFLLALFFQVCKSKEIKEFDVVKIQVVDSVKVVFKNDSLVDSVPKSTPNESILIDLSKSKLKFKKDSLRTDSLQKVRFRRATKIVNGGYNGWDSRLKDWIKIKRILTDTIK